MTWHCPLELMWAKSLLLEAVQSQVRADTLRNARTVHPPELRLRNFCIWQFLPWSLVYRIQQERRKKVTNTLRLAGSRDLPLTQARRERISSSILSGVQTVLAVSA